MKMESAVFADADVIIWRGKDGGASTWVEGRRILDIPLPKRLFGESGFPADSRA